MKTTYENRWMRVDDHEDGWFSVATTQPAGAVIIPMHMRVSGTRRMFALVSQYRPAIGQHTYEFPRGATDDVSMSEAQRELAEETGVTSQSLRALGTIYPDTGLMQTEVGVWLSVTRNDDEPNEHAEEDTDVRTVWVSESDLHSLVSSGTIRCAITLAAYLRLLACGVLNLP